MRWVTRKWKVIDVSTAECNALGVPHVLNETDYYKGYVFPKGSLIIPNAWYAPAIITHILSRHIYPQVNAPGLKSLRGPG